MTNYINYTFSNASTDYDHELAEKFESFLNENLQFILENTIDCEIEVNIYLEEKNIDRCSQIDTDLDVDIVNEAIQQCWEQFCNSL